MEGDLDIMQTELDAVTPEMANEVITEDLVPSGKYEGVLLDYTVRTSDYDPFTGKSVVRAHVELYDCPHDSGRTRHYYFNMCPSAVRGEGGKLRGESRLATHLSEITGFTGQPFDKALEAAKTMRLRFRIRLSPAKDGFDPRNWTDAISSVRL